MCIHEKETPETTWAMTLDNHLHNIYNIYVTIKLIGGFSIVRLENRMAISKSFPDMYIKYYSSSSTMHTRLIYRLIWSIWYTGQFVIICHINTNQPGKKCWRSFDSLISYVPEMECYGLVCLPFGKLTKLWKITTSNAKAHYKWQCSIAMLVITRR